MPKAAKTSKRVAPRPRAQSIPKTAAKPMSPPAAAQEKENAYGNTEEQICELVLAADLASSIIEETLTSQRLKPDYFGKEKGDVSNLVMIGDQLHERLLFVVYEVEKRAQALKKHLYDIDGV